jgi:hypothetical protein
MSSVKVAVRVRPFNQREKDQNSVSIIDMDGVKTTTIRNPVSTSILANLVLGNRREKGLRLRLQLLVSQRVHRGNL